MVYISEANRCYLNIYIICCRSDYACAVCHVNENCYRPHPKDGEGTVCSLFVSPHVGGGIPQSGRLGGYPIPGLAGGYPSQVWMGGTWGTPLDQVRMGYPPPDQVRMGYPPGHWTGYPPGLGQDGVPPWPGLDGVPPWTWDGVPPDQVRMGHPPDQVWMGYPLDLGWGTPRPGQDGAPPWPGLDGVPPRPGTGYPPRPGMGYPPPNWDIASTCYAAGGMPLAFTQEDFLVTFMSETFRGKEAFTLRRQPQLFILKMQLSWQHLHLLPQYPFVMWNPQ